MQKHIVDAEEEEEVRGVVVQLFLESLCPCIMVLTGKRRLEELLIRDNPYVVAEGGKGLQKNIAIVKDFSIRGKNCNPVISRPHSVAMRLSLSVKVRHSCGSLHQKTS